MLRWLIIFVFLASGALPVEGEKHISIAQMENLLAADRAAHKQDSEIAEQIAGVVLSERLPQPTLGQLIAQFGAGPQTSLELKLLADQSEFLELPPGDSGANAVPESDAQARMIQAARDYVSQTLRRLPNLLSTRTINRYDDTPHAIKPGEWPTRSGLHEVATSQAEVSVNTERESQPPAQNSAAWQPGIGLLSGGEFGNTLGMILTDAAAGNVSWSHWERTSAGRLAAFRYSVPASASHFEVISSFQRGGAVEAVKSVPGARGVSGITVQPSVSSSNVEVTRTRPAYHGSIWIDPADGAIYRITMEADKGLPSLRRAAILVEYGPVEIAGSRYVCPVRSLARSEAVTTVQSISGDAATVWLNETLFSDYHRFGSSSRILGPANASASDTSPAAAEPTATNDQPAPAQNTNMATPAQVAGEETPSFNPAPAPPSPPPPSAPAASAMAPETSASGKASLPVQLPSSNAPSVADKGASPPPISNTSEDHGFTLRVNVNSLLVPAVVLDKNGKAVGNLGEHDFVVTDGGKVRKITGFTLVKSARNTTGGGLDRGQSSTTGVGAGAVSATTTEPAQPRNRFLIFLFDDRHMTTAELPLVQNAATRLLERPLPETDYADVLSLMGVSSGITHNRAAIQSAIMKLTVHQAFQPVKEDCPSVDYYSANQIINDHNPMEFQIAVEKAKQCSSLQTMVSPSGNLYDGMSNPQDPFQRAALAAATHALALGEEDARESLISVRNVVGAMSKLPGQRVLILVSPGFLTLSPETMALKSEIMDLAAASDVVVNTLDARGLYVGNLDASQGGTTSTIGLMTGQPMQEHLASMQANENALSELAQGTGGRFFHNSNDLQGGLETLTAAPENLYLLEISLKDVKADHAYHRLQVKVNQPGLEVLARKGYFAPGKESDKK